MSMAKKKSPVVCRFRRSLTVLRHHMLDAPDLLDGAAAFRLFGDGGRP